ncbi:hypothetical protein Taro_021040 [Colocasia esculenta]|uniref:X8 domain-containing protein n=1 Tax=Colocasia esculenta TaxID=4460 RepID=A0A843V473_COLES|nr:hypothetical protein [Colocasia esculenta]
MAVLLLLLLLSALSGGSDAAWCVCRTDATTAAQLGALNYACGTSADCSPILANGSCYQPNTVLDHCSYAVNSYYQRQSQAALACDFSGAAVLTNTDPSTSGCSYPANARYI